MSIQVKRYCFLGLNPICYEMETVTNDDVETFETLENRVKQCLEYEWPKVVVTYGFIYKGIPGENKFNSYAQIVKCGFAQNYAHDKGVFRIKIFIEDKLSAEELMKFEDSYGGVPLHVADHSESEAAIQQVIAKKITLETELARHLPRAICKLVGSYFSFFLVGDASQNGCCVLL